MSVRHGARGGPSLWPLAVAALPDPAADSRPAFPFRGGHGAPTPATHGSAFLGRLRHPARPSAGNAAKIKPRQESRPRCWACAASLARSWGGCPDPGGLPVPGMAGAEPPGPTKVLLMLDTPLGCSILLPTDPHHGNCVGRAGPPPGDPVFCPPPRGCCRLQLGGTEAPAPPALPTQQPRGRLSDGNAARSSGAKKQQRQPGDCAGGMC